MVIVKTRWSREWKITALSMVIFVALFLGLYFPSNNNNNNNNNEDDNDNDNDNDDDNDDETSSSSVSTSSPSSSSSSPTTLFDEVIIIIISQPTISPTTTTTSPLLTLAPTTTNTIIDNKNPPTPSPVVTPTSSPTITRPTTTSPTPQPTLEPTNSPTTNPPSEVPTTTLRPSHSPSSSSSCLETNMFVLDITFDVFASETSWNFVNLRTEEIIYESPSYYDDDGLSSSTTTFVGCLPDGSYIFTLFDLCGDGMMYPGHYELTTFVGGIVILSGDDSSFLDDQVSVSFDVPFNIDDYSSPTPSPTVCPETNVFVLELTFDYYSDETSWDIIIKEEDTTTTGSNTIIIIYESPDYGHYIAGATVIETGCILLDGRYIFRLYDSFGDGLLGVDDTNIDDDGSYKFSVGGSVIASGGDEEFDKITVSFEVPYYDIKTDETLIID